MKTIKDGMSVTHLNQFRFKVMRGLARGTITTKEAKDMLGVQTAINQAASYVANDESDYVRVEGMVSALAH
ncbi:MAG: hypothetical protein HOL48_03015 [Porticoccaceae bacterium]|nr:hypothetical protein [Porticoccaceae bacterium]